MKSVSKNFHSFRNANGYRGHEKVFYMLIFNDFEPLMTISYPVEPLNEITRDYNNTTLINVTVDDKVCKL